MAGLAGMLVAEIWSGVGVGSTSGDIRGVSAGVGLAAPVSLAAGPPQATTIANSNDKTTAWGLSTPIPAGRGSFSVGACPWGSGWILGGTEPLPPDTLCGAIP